MGFSERFNNIYVLDTRMFDFEHYQSCYIVGGKEIVLVDAGIPTQLENFRAEMKKHGFSFQDISKIFLTHCEHPDHAGNVGTIIKENPRIKVYINPVGLEYLTQPWIENEARKKVMLPQLAARFGEQSPVPRGNIELLRDGERFDIGDGEILTIMFTPAHQPGGLVIFESKNNGLFIDDLTGNYFQDIDFSLVLTPPRSDVMRGLEDINRFKGMSLRRLYLGHFGISDSADEVLSRVSSGIQRIMAIAEQCVKEGKPEEIEPRVLASKMPEVEKLKKRSQTLYEYTRDELITHHSTYFAKYYLEQTKRKSHDAKFR